jgi:serine/threonine-protein kinase RsbW
MFSRQVSANGHPVIRLEFTSAVEMLDLVQVVVDHVGRDCGFDEDVLHWVGVAIRESVVNAITHGNRNDLNKHVFVDFDNAPGGEDPGLVVCVRDQGTGFDPDSLADPLEPENLLKSGGRGVFLIRNFMDDVQLHRVPEGGMEIRMLKRFNPAGQTSPVS